MFRGLASIRQSCGIRFSSTLPPVQVKNTMPPKIKVFPKLSEITAEEVYGTKPFGGSTRSYFVKRTRFGHLPVYKTIKSKAPYTEIRKVSGNLIQFRADLIELIPEIPAKEFKLIQQSQKILIRGDYVDLIRSVLETKF